MWSIVSQENVKWEFKCHLKKLNVNGESEIFLYFCKHAYAKEDYNED